MPKKKIKLKGKVKNISQTVVVNVGGRKKSSAPTQPRPTPLQQATQFIQATRPQQGESLIQSAQVLQRLLEPTNLRLEALLRQQRQPAQPINIGQPNINVPITQPININLPAQRDRVLDQPDAPLVQPPPPLVPAGPQRLDPPHQDVPLSSISLVSSDEEEEEVVDEGKREASSSSSDPYESYYDRLDSLPVESRDKKQKTVSEIAKYHGITLSYRDKYGDKKKYTKAELIEKINNRIGR